VPGGRLTQQERQRIAQGLADGLAYAEIARGLDRPTSTVTREVMRNGGPTAYRSDLAQRSSERRAQRRRRAEPRGQAPARGDGRDDAALAEYEETFTTLIMQKGLPAMMARVLTCLFTAETGSLTAAELVTRLQVSPAVPRCSPRSPGRSRIASSSTRDRGGCQDSNSNRDLRFDDQRVDRTGP
jgi:hypothetical protein